MTKLPSDEKHIEQLFVEELYIYCSADDLIQTAERLQRQLCSFLGFADLPAFAVQEHPDDFDLADTLPEGTDLSNMRSYKISQSFNVLLPDTTEDTIDEVSEQVFSAVQAAAGEIPYFSFLDVIRDDKTPDDD